MYDGRNRNRTDNRICFNGICQALPGGQLSSFSERRTREARRAGRVPLGLILLEEPACLGSAVSSVLLSRCTTPITIRRISDWVLAREEAQLNPIAPLE
jgi:hypothetical protein